MNIDGALLIIDKNIGLNSCNDCRMDCEKCEIHIAFMTIKKSLESQQKYRWHDLMKDPNDLPKKGETVLVCGVHHGYEVGTFNGSHEYNGKSVWEWKKHTVKTVIAWREIEPFEEK